MSLSLYDLFFEYAAPVHTNKVEPFRPYSVVELFAGGGGFSIGMERAGFSHLLLNEIDPNACKTLRTNRPEWNVVEGSIEDIDFTPYAGKADVVTGGFPCQSFSYIGKELGFDDTRGTLFFEFARAINEIKPSVFVGENVRGIWNHDNGRTLETIVRVLGEIGYTVYHPQLLDAHSYRCPQKRERVFIVGVRKDLEAEYEYPNVCMANYTLQDALKKGDLYPCDVPKSEGAEYAQKKKAVLDLIPAGGNWRNLPNDVMKAYMSHIDFDGDKPVNVQGGQTNFARRTAWGKPCPTLTTSPAQKMSDRCHPEETRPFTVREYARIQTFPDSWVFEGTLSSAYKQIGNDVPVNLAEEVGYSVIQTLNKSELGLCHG